MAEKIDLDIKDKKILQELQKDARQKYTEIARNTQLPVDVVQYRVNKLEEKGVIRSYHASLDPQKLGYPLYAYVVFSLYSLEPEEEKKLINYLTEHNQVVYVSKNSGKWDIVIGVCGKDYQGMDSVIKEVRRKFTDAVKDFMTIPVIEEYKFDHMVDLIEVEDD